MEFPDCVSPSFTCKTKLLVNMICHIATQSLYILDYFIEHLDQGDSVDAIVFRFSESL